MPTRKVCCISEAEATAYRLHRVRPDCRAHLHVSRREAREWANDSYGPARRHSKVYGSELNPQIVVTYHQRPQARWEGEYLVIEAVRIWQKSSRLPEGAERSIHEGIRTATGRITQRGPRLATLQMRP